MNIIKNVVKTAITNEVVKETDDGYLVLCTVCNKFRLLKTRESTRRACKSGRSCDSCSKRERKLNKKLSNEHKLSMSLAQKRRYSDINERIKTKNSVKIAMHRSDVRKKHIDALYGSDWVKVKTDKGQLELLNKWDRLGFKFEPNYQVHTDEDLFYLDGYDSYHNVVLEYDGKYHMQSRQKELDLIRQNKIIELLKPNVFWRYNSVEKKFYDVYRLNNSKQTVHNADAHRS